VAAVAEQAELVLLEALVAMQETEAKRLKVETEGKR
jgi:hypothetical protein